MNVAAIDTFAYSDGVKIYTTGSELALLMTWKRRGALALLRGYYAAALYRCDWGGLDHSRILDWLKRAIFELEDEIGRGIRPAAIRNAN